jgi:hypothetical protein
MNDNRDRTVINPYRKYAEQYKREYGKLEKRFPIKYKRAMKNKKDTKKQ